MFTRIKNIKGKEYAYKVKNKWTKKGPRQKTVKYLGRVHNFDKKKDIDFFQEHKITDIKDYTSNTKWKQIVQDLLICELKSHGFRNEENVWVCEDIAIDFKENQIFKGKRNAVLSLNEGFLCNDTLQEALTFKPKGLEQEVAYNLANVLVSAGISIPQELFISVYEKIMD